MSAALRSNTFRSSVLGSIFASLVLTIAGIAPPVAAEVGEIAGVTTRGPDGITETVGELMARDAMNPQPPFDPATWTEGEEVELPHNKQPLQDSLDIPRFPYDPSEDWSQDRPSPFLPQSVGTSIAGPGRSADGIGAVPPDSMGDVGPTQVLMHSNGRIKVYDKLTGALGGLDVTDSTFWTSVRNGAGVSDPRVEYDRLSGRWFVTMINTTATLNRILIAVSSGPTITNSTSFTFFQITTATQFLDYETLGVDANAVYIGGNIFTTSSGTFASTRGYVINKASLLAGSLVFTTFDNLATGSGAGPLTPQGVSNDDPSATEGYFIGADNAAFSLLQIRRVSNPGGATPTISGNISLTVPTTVYPIFTQTYQGAAGGRSLDALDDRLFQAQITRDVISGRSTLWAAQNIQVTAAGVASGTGGRNGSRWYEIDNLTTAPTLRQSGTLFDSAASNPNGYWIPSTAMSSQGHMVLGASSAGAARFPELWAAGRLRTDTLGATQSPTQLQASSFTYNLEAAGTTQRWGDYSKTGVDPCDSQSIWHVGEYADAANSWRLRAVQLRAAGPPVSSTPVPASVSIGATNVSVVVTGASSAGTEFFDNPAGYVCSASCSTTGTGTCHIAAAVTGVVPAGTPITINSITFNTPTQVTLNVSATGATAGTHTVQVRNPDGQSTSFNITVSAPSNPSFAPAAAIARQQGSPSGAAVTIGTVTDPDTPIGSLTVTQIAGGTASGVTSSGITNTAGTIAAAVAASCNASTGTVRFQVSDGALTGTGDLTVNVSANAGPTLTYGAQSVLQAGSSTINPATGPSDNGSVASIVLQSPGTYTGTISVNNSTGVVSISAAAPVGVHTITIRSADNCGATTDSSFQLTVNSTAPSFAPAGAISRQQGSPAGAAVTVGTVSDLDTPVATLTVTQIAGGTSAGVSASAITNTAGTISAAVAASCAATAGTLRFQASDGSQTGTGDLSVNVTANSAPVLTYTAQSAAQSGSLTVNPASGPSDNGSVASIVLQSAGTYTGTISVDNVTGVVSISNAAPLGTHTITVRITDNCTATTDASFQLDVVNTPPTFTPAAAISRQQGSAAGAAVTVGTVADAQTAAGSLTVTAIAGGTATGLTVAGISNTTGTVAATVAASCTATTGTQRFQVSDGSLTGTGDLTVNVSANTGPTLTYSNQSVNGAGALTVNPASGPTDNGTVTTALQSQGTYTGTISVDTAGVVTISNAAPIGTHTITIRATDNCNSFIDASFQLQVNNTAPSFTPAAAISRQQGSAAGSAVTVGTVSDAQTAAGSLTVTAIAGGTATGLTVAGISNTTGTVAATVAASCTATTGTQRFQVSDGSLTGTGELTVNVSANTGPTLTYSNQSVNGAGSSTINPAIGPTDNGSVASVVVQSQGTYTGTISVNAAGVVSISNAAPIGTHTITIRTTDNCNAITDASFQLQVINTAPTFTPAAAIGRQQGSDAGPAVTIGTAFDAQTAAGSLTVSDTGTGTASGIVVAGITNTAGTISATLAAQCFATAGTVRLQVSDGSLSSTGDLQVNVSANTPPALGSYSAATTAIGSSLLVPASVAPSDNGSLALFSASISPAGFTGTLSANSSTGAISISNAAPTGPYTVTVTAFDNCDVPASTTFSLTVMPDAVFADGFEGP